jgi:hypothetical protein
VICGLFKNKSKAALAKTAIGRIFNPIERERLFIENLLIRPNKTNKDR